MCVYIYIYIYLLISSTVCTPLSLYIYIYIYTYTWFKLMFDDRVEPPLFRIPTGTLIAGCGRENPRTKNLYLRGLDSLRFLFERAGFILNNWIPPKYNQDSGFSILRILGKQIYAQSPY